MTKTACFMLNIRWPSGINEALNSYPPTVLNLPMPAATREKETPAVVQ
jgi:hypothetical protein